MNYSPKHNAIYIFKVEGISCEYIGVYDEGFTTFFIKNGHNTVNSFNTRNCKIEWFHELCYFNEAYEAGQKSMTPDWIGDRACSSDKYNKD